jgi:hypothetical protein
MMKLEGQHRLLVQRMFVVLGYEIKTCAGIDEMGEVSDECLYLQEVESVECHTGVGMTLEELHHPVERTMTMGLQGACAG